MGYRVLDPVKISISFILTAILLSGCPTQPLPRIQGRGVDAELATAQPEVHAEPPAEPPQQNCGLSLRPPCFRGEVPVCIRRGFMPEWACAVAPSDPY